MYQFCEASPCRDMGQGKKLTYCTTLKRTIVVFKQTRRHVDVDCTIGTISKQIA